MFENYFVTSDTHFDHKNIIKYADRPFDSVEHMNTVLVDNINEIVGKNDILIHLGDFSFNSNKDMIKEVVNEINCKNIMLLLGNHDRSKSMSFWNSLGLKEIHRYPFIMNEFFIFSHEPMFMNDSMPYVNFHGHIHQNSIASDKFINCCVEVNEYKPIRISDIKYIK